MQIQCEYQLLVAVLKEQHVCLILQLYAALDGPLLLMTSLSNYGTLTVKDKKR